MAAATPKQRRKSGPRTIYIRDKTETMLLSSLAKQLLRVHSARCNVGGVGEFVEHLARTRAAQVQPQEFADDRRAP